MRLISGTNSPLVSFYTLQNCFRFLIPVIFDLESIQDVRRKWSSTPGFSQLRALEAYSHTLHRCQWVSSFLESLFRELLNYSQRMIFTLLQLLLACLRESTPSFRPGLVSWGPRLFSTSSCSSMRDIISAPATSPSWTQSSWRLLRGRGLKLSSPCVTQKHLHAKVCRRICVKNGRERDHISSTILNNRTKHGSKFLLCANTRKKQID